MDSNISKVFVPVRPLSSVSDNCISMFRTYSEQGKEESYTALSETDSRKERHRLYDMVVNYWGRRVTHFEVGVSGGESIFWTLRPLYQNEFICEGFRKRNVKLFLIKDPLNEQVQLAAKKVCRRRHDVYVLVDELPDLSARKSSFLTLLLKYDDVLRATQEVDWKGVILHLARVGFYFKDGFVRCNGCEYRKDIWAFADIISRSFGGQCTTGKPNTGFLQKDCGVGAVYDHDDSNCYLAELTRKTLFAAGASGLLDRCVEQGHFYVYQHLSINNYLDRCAYPVPTPYCEVKEMKKSRKIPNISIDRFMHSNRDVYLFTTTVPKKDFLTQDDLLYEASDIKALFDRLRLDYAELNGMIDQFGKSYPMFASGLCFPPLYGLLTVEVSRIYFRIFDIIAKADADSLLCSDKLRLQKLLDQLMASIVRCGGTVAEKGLICLSIEAGDKTQHECFQYGNSDEGCDELFRIRHRWMELGSDYLGLVSEKILSPLLDVFSPFELGHDVLHKLFSASEIYLDSLSYQAEQAVTCASGSLAAKTPRDIP